ncbi:hypothetical protein RUM44_013603 [Polyplax serrata]|uniref:Uncharacterized protein n=1 Tax=Polyplax serrata TaxID=468196 RepID=A0ABR1BEL2_POLSC
MSETPIKPLIDFIGELLTILWLLLAFFVSVIVLLGQKIDTIAMPSFRSLSFGQKGREEIPDVDDGGFLNRKIVVEKVKNVFGKTLKSREKSEDDEFDIKKMMKIFQNGSGKKCVTFAEKDEVIDEVVSEFETTTSFRGDDEEEVEEDVAPASPEQDSVDTVDGCVEKTVEVKNLLFHEVDENFKPEQVAPTNYSNVGFWLTGSPQTDILTLVVGQEPPSPPSEPPPLPPKMCQKYLKSRPSVPPPLPPKTVTEVKPPEIRRDLKRSKTEPETSVAELVNNFTKLQERSSPENGKIPIEEKFEKKSFILETRPITFLNHVGIENIFREKVSPPTFSTFKPEVVHKKDWKETFFQPVNKTFVSECDTEKPKLLLKNGLNGKSTKIPKLVEEMIEKALEKRTSTAADSFDPETLKKCKINVSNLVNNFEQIQRNSKNQGGKYNGVAEPKTNGIGVPVDQPIATSPKTVAKSNWIYNGRIETVSGESGPSSQVSGSDEPETEIFFRAGVLAQLESQRDEKLADLVIQLQSRCRGYLARKKLAKLKVQDLAVKCIQRNVRKLMQVREWPWWRLYVKVTPLLNVQRTEEELTAKIQELENLKATLEKVEADRNHLKLENEKLEAKGKSVIFLRQSEDAGS